MPEKNLYLGKLERPHGRAYIYYFWEIDDKAVAPEHEEDLQP